MTYQGAASPVHADVHYCPVIKKSNGRLSLDGIDDFRALTLLTI